MGQRLNIEIVKNGKVLANSYYHWSGYSNTAVNLTEEIINYYDYVKKYQLDDTCNDKDILFAIRLLEKTGAGIYDIEKARGILENHNIKLNVCKGRNEGIIEITQKGINENRSWEEARVSIDIEKQIIDFNVFDEYELKELLEDYNEMTREDIKDININFKEIAFDNIFDIKAFIDKANYNDNYYFYNAYDNKYIGLIL